jgi:hypothetical protein
MATASVTPKSAPKLTAVKPAAKKPAPAPKPEWDRLTKEGRGILKTAAQQVYRVTKQLEALEKFCTAITEKQDSDIYNFSVGMFEMLDLIRREAWNAHAVLGKLWDVKADGHTFPIPLDWLDDGVIPDKLKQK